MKKKELDDKLGELFPEGVNGESHRDLEELRKVYNLLMNDEDPEPPESLDEKFYELLKEDRIQSRAGRFLTDLSGLVTSGRFLRSMRVAAGIALFLLGWFGASRLGPTSHSQMTRLSDEVGQLKETLILTMLENSSPAERIQAVNMVDETSNIDDKITSSLLNVLSNDPNDNVRLVALETLVEYADYPNVREGLIRSINSQNSPLVQVRLAEIMVALEERRSVEEFQRILSDITLDYSVRDQLNRTVEQLL